MSETEGSSGGRAAVLLGLAAFVGTGVIAMKVVLGGAGAPAAAPPGSARAPAGREGPPSIFQEAREQTELQAEVDGWNREEGESKSSLDLAPRIGLAQPGSAPPPANPYQKQRPVDGPPGPADEPFGAAAREDARYRLTDAERAALAEKAGGDIEDEDRMAKIGGSYGLMQKLMDQIGKHPKLVGWVINNEFVVDAFMSRSKTQRVCSDGGAAKAYATNTADPAGVSRTVTSFKKVIYGHPKMPEVVFGSKLVSRALECPGFKSFLADQDAIRGLATGNSDVLQMMSDPNILVGITANPAVMGAVSKTRAAMTGN